MPSESSSIGEGGKENFFVKISCLYSVPKNIYNLFFLNSALRMLPRRQFMRKMDALCAKKRETFWILAPLNSHYLQIKQFELSLYFFCFSAISIILISNNFVILSAQIYSKYLIILTVYSKIYVLKGKQLNYMNHYLHRNRKTIKTNQNPVRKREIKLGKKGVFFTDKTHSM